MDHSSLRPLFFISLFWFREGGKKNLRKKNIEPIFVKVNGGAQIKKTFDEFLEKLMRVTK